MKHEVAPGDQNRSDMRLSFPSGSVRMKKEDPGSTHVACLEMYGMSIWSSLFRRNKKQGILIGENKLENASVICESEG